jgi:hypothetical protein
MGTRCVELIGMVTFVVGMIIGFNLGFSPSLFYRSQRHEADCALPVTRNR